MIRDGKTLSVYIVGACMLVGVYLFFTHIEKEYMAITTFKECVDAGYPILEKYPEECKIPGKVFVNTEQIKEEIKEDITVISELYMNPKNTSYTIEGAQILLTDGVYVSNEQTVTYFGKELRVDLDNDTDEDSSFIATVVHASSTDIAYYLVVSRNEGGEYRGTNGVLLGENISPLSTEFKNNTIVVTYKEKEKQSVRSVYLRDGTLTEINN